MNFLILGFIMGISSGCAVITAQRFGAKDDGGVRASVAMNIVLNLGFCLVITALSLVTMKPILRLINTPPEIFDASVSYIGAIYSGIIAAVIYNLSACLLRALGDSKSPLYFLVISSLLNIVLDIIFILNFHMGVAGAAWATVVSQFVAGLLTIVYIIKRFPILCVGKKDFAFMSPIPFAWQHLRIGLPMAFQFSITAIGIVIIQGALNIFGPAIIAGFTAAQKIEQLIMVFGIALGVTMTNYTGQNLGAGRYDRIKSGTRQCTLLSLLFALIGIAVVFLFSDQMAALFVEKSELSIITACRQYLWYTAPFYPALFMIFLYRNVLQSMDKPFVPLLCAFLELFARAIAAYTLPGPLGYIGICLSEPLAWIVAAVPLVITFAREIRRIDVSPDS
jgi:putative MATE family efflux protein